MAIAKEEIFGPVVAAMPFDDLNDLIVKVNDSDFGLASGIWTQDIKKAHYLAQRIKVGTEWVNCYNAFMQQVHLAATRNLVLIVKWEVTY